MRLPGRAAWWAPGPLARFYGRFGIKETDMPMATDKRVPVTAG
jgi:RND superfamily putative drug exporter